MSGRTGRHAAIDLLAGIGKASADAPFDLAEAALAFAVLARPELDLGPYRRHLAELVAAVAARAEHLEDKPDGDATLRQAAALCTTFVENYGYQGDRETYDDLDNADLARVIDRRRGLPVALGILWMHAARAQGWAIEGLAFPGHFLLRLGAGAAGVILDPFDLGRIHDAASLRGLIKATISPEAELAPAHYAAVGDRDVLLRLENNIKLRLIREGRLPEAADLIASMLLVAPRQPALWRELGLIQARLGNLQHAALAMQTFIDLQPSPEEIRHAAQVLRDLKNRLN